MPAQAMPAQAVPGQPVPGQSSPPAPQIVYVTQPYGPPVQAPAGPQIPHQYTATPYSAVPYSAPAYPSQQYPYPYGHPVSGAYGQPVSGYAYGPYQANPWAAPPVVGPSSGAAKRWIGGGIVLALVLAAIGVGALAGYVSAPPVAQAGWRDAGSATTVMPPAQNAPAAEWTNWAEEALSDALNAQAKALLDGNEAGYLSVVDQSNATLVTDHQRRFKVLHAMAPGVWRERVDGRIKDSGDHQWDAAINISYCFGPATCSVVHLVEGSTWELQDGRLMMVDLDQSTSDQIGPRPWETDDLSVVQGQRVVIAATKTNQWRLDEAAQLADKAAAVADTLAKWSPPPGRYVIYLAAPDEWTKWYGHSQPEWAAAWAVPVSDVSTEVVVRTAVVPQRGLQLLLTHELTHVTTLAGKRDGANSDGAWWLIEGVADYATMIGKAVNTYDSMSSTRKFVRGGWDGNPAVSPPSTNASVEEAGGRYGVAFLTIRRISDKYGQDKMLNFWGRVVHDNQDLDAAARAELGAPWAAVSADCATFIRASAG
jgi:hypothetical protein